MLHELLIGVSLFLLLFVLMSAYFFVLRKFFFKYTGSPWARAACLVIFLIVFLVPVLPLVFRIAKQARSTPAIGLGFYLSIVLVILCTVLHNLFVLGEAITHRKFSTFGKRAALVIFGIALLGFLIALVHWQLPSTREMYKRLRNVTTALIFFNLFMRLARLGGLYKKGQLLK